METIDQEKELRAKKSGRFIAYASVLLAVIYAIYLLLL